MSHATFWREISRLQVIQNVRKTGSNLCGIGYKALAKHAARETLKATITEEVDPQEVQNQEAVLRALKLVHAHEVAKTA